MTETRRLLLFILIFLGITLFGAVNMYIENTYDLSLYEYMQYSIPITDEEVNYLSEKGTIYFSSDKNAPPFAYIENTNGQYKGLVLDYASALSIELGVDIEFVPQVWENVINSVISGEADMCDIFPSEDRMKYFAFSEPIYSLRAIAMTRNIGDIFDSNDLRSLKVAVPAGDYAVEYLKDNIVDVNIVETSDLFESVREFKEGKVDAVVGDEPVLLHFADEMGLKDNVKILDEALYEREVCIGVSKNNIQLVNILNKGILRLKKTNSVENIQQKWFGISVPILKNKVPESLMISLTAIISTLFLFFMLSAMWSLTLTNEVKKRTFDLNRSRNNLQITVDALSSFLVCVDENGLIVNANKSFCNFIKKEKKEVEGIDYRQFLILGNIDINNVKNNNEFMFKGRYYIFSISEIEYYEYKYLIVVEDFTDSKISQQQILQQNKMIALGQLAAGVAHEIRNPIGLIQNYCYILKTYIFNENKVAEESIDVIESSVQRVDKIVNNLLNFSHMQNNKDKVVDLKESILDIVSLENKLMLRNNIKVEVNCGDHIKFLTSPESLNHIFLNLLSNSIDSMDDGGKISIDCSIENKYLMIDFKDTGKGINQENLELIFNPFFTTKKVGQGTGLGLYIVYNEVQKIGGKIKVHSQPGHGTSFRLEFPLQKEMC